MSIILFNNTHYSQNYCPIPLSKKNTKKMLPYIAACNASYKNDESWIRPFQLSFLCPNDLNLNLASLPGAIEARATSFFDKNTLLKVSICQSAINEQAHLYVLGGAFGSGDVEASNDQEKENFRNVQILTRDSQLVGKIPPTYVQLNDFMNILLSHPSLKNKRVTLIGHSSGGSMAQYVSLKNDLHAICFNPYPLGQGLQQDIGQRIETAPYHISCISIAGDFCSDALDRGLSRHPRTKLLQENSAKNFGMKYLVPSAFSGDENKTHGLVLASFLKYLNYDERTLPSQLKLKDLEFCSEALNQQDESSDLIPIESLRAYKNHLEQVQENYVCQSRLAALAQAINQKNLPLRKLAFEFLNQDEKRIICQYIYENAGSPSTDDLQWGEHHAFDYPFYLETAVCRFLFTKLAKLSQGLKNQVYEQLYYLAGWPQTQDLQWGEHHATEQKYFPHLADALFYVYQNNLK